MEQKNNSIDFKKRFHDCDNKFNTLFDLTSVASKVIGSDLTILRVNDALVELLGYESDEIVGTTILDYACEAYKEHWHDLQEALWLQKVPSFKLQACLHAKDKRLVWVNVTTILYEDQGETYGFTVLDDITGIKQLEDAQRRLNLALKYSRMAVWEFDLVNNSVYRSEGHDEIFGYKKQQDDWTIESYYTHFEEKDLFKFRNALSSIVPGGKIDLQARLITANGTVRWVNIQGVLEADQKGKLIKILGTISDITRDKLIERHKDDFISVASHEMKTPVTSLKATLQLLDRMKSELPPAVQQLITLANRSVGKMIALIDDLLNAGKSYNDQLKLRKSAFNLSELMDECCGHLRVQGVAVRIEGDQDIRVRADAERIERVMVNLLSNAVKYSPLNEPIVIRIDKSATAVKIAVMDKGMGIPPEKQTLLFERYYQANTSEGAYSGLGLGLYISSEIIKKHGGEMDVISEVGQGSTFWFTLPL